METQQSPDVDVVVEAIDRFREAVWAAKGIDGGDEQDQHATMAAFVLELERAIREKLAGGNEVEDIYAMGLVAELAKEAGPDWTARNIPFLRELGVKLPALPEDAPRTGYAPVEASPEELAKMPAHMAAVVAADYPTAEDRASIPTKRTRRADEPTIYPCGCSWLRVSIGRCDHHDADGKERPTPGTPVLSPVEMDARRYRRLRILGVPKTTDDSEMLLFSNLDGFVDHDLRIHTSRGEARESAPPAVVAPVTATIVQDILSLANVFVRRVDIEAWTDTQRDLATNWAAACHADASDHHDVKVPPRPDFLPAAENDVPAWWFAEMGTADERDVVTTTAAHVREGASALYSGIFSQPPDEIDTPGDDIPYSKYRLKRWADEWYEWAEKICAANHLPFEPGMGLYTVPQMRAAIGHWANAKRKVFETLDRLQTATMERDTAYVERTRLIALVAAFCHQAGLPVGLGQHDPDDAKWDPEWRTIVFVEIPDGIGGSFQASWHIGDRDRELVAYLPKYDKPWDGHTTREKYLRIAAAAERLATGTGETVLARWEFARKFLDAINRRGGLGHKTHRDIDEILRFPRTQTKD